MMDIAELRLKRLEAEYAECIAAGQRTPPQEQTTHYEQLESDSPEEGSVVITTPEPIETENYVRAPREIPHLTADQISCIKSHMSSIKLKHEPSWAASLSDEQFSKIFSKIFASDNSQCMGRVIPLPYIL